MDKYLDLARGLKKLWNMKMMVILVVDGALGTTPERLVKQLDDLEIKRQMKNHLKYIITKIGQNTEKNPGDLRKLDFQTPVKKTSANVAVNKYYERNKMKITTATIFTHR